MTEENIPKLEEGEDRGSWSRRPDGIYTVLLPEHVTITKLSKIMMAMVQYRDRINEVDLTQRVLVDGSLVSRFDAPARIFSATGLRIIPKVCMAIYNRSEKHKKLDESFDKFYPPPDNFKYFDNKEEAISWLLSK